MLLALAGSLHAQKKTAETMTQLNRLQTEYPKSPLRAHAHYRLGELAQGQKKYEEAITLYEQALTLSPKGEAGSQALYAIGLAWSAKRDDARAILAFGRHLDTFPFESDARREPIVHIRDNDVPHGRLRTTDRRRFAT